MEVFQDYAYYYNTFYQDKDYEKEAKQIDVLLKKYGENIQTIINYGCGTGKHDIEFSRLGYKSTGIDASSSMIKMAQQNRNNENVSVDFFEADIRTFVPKQKYDAVVSLFHVMSYQNETEDILAAFHSARKALNKDGIFLFDVWYGSGVLSDKPVVRVKQIEDETNKLIRIAVPVMHEKRNIVDVQYEIFVIDKDTRETKIIKEVHNMRYFFRPEIEFYLKESDFVLLDNLDCRTLGETRYDSWTSYFIAKAV